MMLDISVAGLSLPGWAGPECRAGCRISGRPSGRAFSWFPVGGISILGPAPPTPRQIKVWEAVQLAAPHPELAGPHPERAWRVAHRRPQPPSDPHRFATSHPFDNAYASRHIPPRF